MINSFILRLVCDLYLTHIRSRELWDHTGQHPFVQQIKTRHRIYWGWPSPGIDTKRSLIIYTSGNRGHVYSRTAVRVVYWALVVDSERTVRLIKCNHCGNIHNRKTWPGAGGREDPRLITGANLTNMVRTWIINYIHSCMCYTTNHS